MQDLQYSGPACECCGCYGKAPHYWECRPHVRFESVCTDCMTDILRDGEMQGVQWDRATDGSLLFHAPKVGVMAYIAPGALAARVQS